MPIAAVFDDGRQGKDRHDDDDAAEENVEWKHGSEVNYLRLTRTA